MMYDDDELDRALARLPLEEPSPGLHTRIMAATVYRPRTAVAAWEVWLVATLAAMAVWLTWIVLSTPHAAERLGDRVTEIVNAGGLTSVSTLLWVGIGIWAAYWVSQLSLVPRRRRES